MRPRLRRPLSFQLVEESGKINKFTKVVSGRVVTRGGLISLFFSTVRLGERTRSAKFPPCSHPLLTLTMDPLFVCRLRLFLMTLKLAVYHLEAEYYCDGAVAKIEGCSIVRPAILRNEHFR